ncbi:hypothetical protein C7402_112236 [Paraburkholderia unamae]|uniref:Mu-like prophage FluMu N-terminal domain-containing protein n=1 Tax=Paraburkholderia unamae TaxID=219649 RepID=A0ABX5KHW2_9BURK|nr:hypothetical protein C7402_112236 [Paraburkholderia unamae]
MSEKIKVVVVAAKRNGYRRAGLLFGETAVNIPASALTQHQIKELAHDRMLQVRQVELDVPSADELLELRRKESIVDELIGALPVDFVWTESPVEYVASLQQQLRAQTERAAAAATEVETLRAAAAESAQSHGGTSASKPHAGRK